MLRPEKIVIPKTYQLFDNFRERQTLYRRIRSVLGKIKMRLRSILASIFGGN